MELGAAGTGARSENVMRELRALRSSMLLLASRYVPPWARSILVEQIEEERLMATRRHLGGEEAVGIARAAWEALCTASQVTIYDAPPLTAVLSEAIQVVARGERLDLWRFKKGGAFGG